MDLDLIIDGEPIHKGKCFVVDKFIDNLVNERGWEVFFKTRMVEIRKVSADTNSALFLLMGMGLQSHEVYTMG